VLYRVLFHHFERFLAEYEMHFFRWRGSLFQRKRASSATSMGKTHKSRSGWTTWISSPSRKFWWPLSEAVNIFHDLLFALEERSRRFLGLLSFPAAFWPATSISLLSLTSLRVAYYTSLRSSRWLEGNIDSKRITRLPQLKSKFLFIDYREV